MTMNDNFEAGNNIGETYIREYGNTDILALLVLTYDAAGVSPTNITSTFAGMHIGLLLSALYPSMAGFLLEEMTTSIPLSTSNNITHILAGMVNAIRNSKLQM